MKTQTEALKLALESLEDFDSLHGDKTQEAIAAIKEALAQPEQEPVAVLFEDGSIVKYEDLEFVPEKSGQRVQMLYTSPPAQRKPLTDEEIERIRIEQEFDQWAISKGAFKYAARAVEAAHGIKGDA